MVRRQVSTIMVRIEEELISVCGTEESKWDS